jgi:hypothetical protein
MYHPTLMDPDTPTERLHLGEVQSTGQYAVGPGSMHKSGKRYTIVDDSEIAKVDGEAILSVLRDCGVLMKKKEEKEVKTYNHQKTHDCDIDITKLCMPLHPVKEGNEIVGEHPLHGATHVEDRGKSRNFSINPRKGVWCCRAHGDSGGGWAEWMAVEIGIMRCDEAGTRKLTKEEYRMVFREAERRGLITRYGNSTSTKETTCSPKLNTTMECISSRHSENQNSVCSRSEHSSIPQELPEGKLLGILGAPREGKTYSAMKWLIAEGEGNYITQNHAIISHALDIFKELGGKGAVHVEGKMQPGMCRRQADEQYQCKTCHMFPGSREPDEFGETHMSLLKKAHDLQRKNNILTKENVPSTLCPYFTLIRAGYEAPYVFTVVNNIESLFEKKVRNRELTIIDEDTTLDFFYPQSIEIASAYRRKEKIHIRSCLDNDNLKSEMEKVKSSDGKKKIKVYVDKMEKIRNTLDAIDGNTLPAKAIGDAIESILVDWIPVNCKVETTGNDSEDEAEFNDVITALMHPYRDQIVSTVTHGGNTKVFLLADERYAIMNMNWYEKANKIAIIGAALTEMFVNQLGGTIIEIPKFKYENNFVVIAVGLDDGEDEKGKKGKIRRKMIEIIKELNRSKDINIMRPMMFLAGSKDEQDSITNAIGGKTFKSTTEREFDLKRIHATGMVMGFFQKSVISRGQDVDQYNVLFAIGTEFAKPFWSAVDREVADKITVDETTNSVFRISPTMAEGRDRAKVVLISEDDVWKIKYLKSRVIKTNTSAKGIARTLIKHNIAGESTFDDTTHSITITKHGVDAEGIYERVFTSLVTADTIIEDDVIESTSQTVLAMLRENWKKMFTKKEIKDKIGIHHDVITNVLEILRYTKKVKVVKSGITVKYGSLKKSQSVVADDGY